MLQFKTKINKILLFTLVILFSLIQLPISLISLKSKKSTVLADYAPSEISISNSSFSSTTSSSLPSDPSSFEAVGTKGSTTSGVINIEQREFETKADDYKLTFNPSKHAEEADNKVLMINNQNVLSNYGYKSTNFNLPKNGYYVVSVFVYTQNADDIMSTASLYLSNNKLDDLESAKIENINTRGSWKQYNFYVKTSTTADESVSLKLFIGTEDNFKSKGAVFFDSLSAYSLSEKDFYTHIDATNSVYTNLSSKDVSSSNGITNGDFENGLTGFTKLTNLYDSDSDNFSKIVGIGDNFDSSDSLLEENPTSANRVNNLKALLIYNKTADYVAYETNDILIEQYKVYKLTFSVKSSAFTNGGANLTLTQKNPFNTENYTVASSKFENFKTTSETSELTNNWINYSFYIVGNAYKDSYATLTFGVGSESTPATGYALFDNLTLEEVTTADYENASESSTVKKVDFTTSESELTVTNGNFNSVKFESTTQTNLAPNSFTLTNSNENNYSSVINLSKTYADFTNPSPIYAGVSESRNNILVMANKQLGTQTLQSSNINLSSNGYFKVSFNVNTQNVVYNNLSACLKSGDAVISYINIPNTNSAWKTVELVIKTFEDSKDATLNIEFNNDLGYVFIDNIKLKTLEEADYTALTENDYRTITALNIDNFSVGAKEGNMVSSATNFTGTTLSENYSVESGIIFKNNYQNSINLNAPSGNANQLMIHNITEGGYSLTSKYTYKLTSGNYYKISVDIKTYNIYQDTPSTNEDGTTNEYGASFALSGLEEKFTAITSDSYSTYTFYVNATSEKTVSAVFGLGDAKSLVRGYAFFDNFVVEKIESADFNSAVKNIDENTKNILAIGNTDTEEDDEDDKSSSSSDTNFDWLVLPTLITSLALLLAIAGTIIRKINFKLPRRIKAVEYDRAKTLIKDYNKREQLKIREEKLAQLRKTLENLQQEIEDNRKEYKDAKSYKTEVENAHAKAEKKLNEKLSNASEKEKLLESKKLLAETKASIKRERKERYIKRREELIAKYLEIEKEIEIILEEEKLLIQEYKEYKRQYKAKKREAKMKKKEK